MGMGESVMLTHGSVYSSRERVNVILYSFGDGVGNNFFPPARGNVREYVRAKVRELIEDLRAGGARLWPAYPKFEVSVREDHVYRGHYVYTVTAVKHGR